MVDIGEEFKSQVPKATIDGKVASPTRSVVDSRQLFKL